MKIYRGEINVKTSGEGDLVNLNGKIEEQVKKSGVREGILHLFAVGSTVALTTIEYEEGLREDLFNVLERVAPRNAEYKHHLRWGDYNGHSHVRASIIGPSISIPIGEGRPILGTWQQVVLVELDTRPRSRKIIATIIGE
ncbi:MAG: secondary thiamine-phosphate synthase enzyme YjbQ [Thaumarchaeota archaeon]|jgi:secondary thiamine-phosphate synthase enzyme|nr:secondary thiamine-phosphate synthase enzyme YjbQ [Candidatus Geocrenenecus arthurdayi]MCL7388984.1 secondary thiamine-phosphate synthase enzyme YjbQ [Candidatus Geocrenenecus arthurdayi]MCL7390615.1 secondary thiamine-phosphate synthase enzyme YjbQ [Candidatus Geocrenenecus arthurdayi]MCL7395868.1 secondary thiamine-phosphate synthase enzyme YjbQ [Candidatus Geocrenenecus arthurdayi]MCL7403322.1 secondary thiamine-phosphate synthase enzyme YjbQ [Candidatus Geocrenenecus arthurdayi]